MTWTLTPRPRFTEEEYDGLIAEYIPFFAVWDGDPNADSDARERAWEEDARPILRATIAANPGVRVCVWRETIVEPGSEGWSANALLREMAAEEAKLCDTSGDQGINPPSPC